MAMPKTKRHGHRPKTNGPEALAARLPAELKTFDAWHYIDGGTPTGLRDYFAALAAQVAPQEPVPVMSAAGLSVSSWYRHMLTSSA